jgi:hypothetical protein
MITILALCTQMTQIQGILNFAMRGSMSAKIPRICVVHVLNLRISINSSLEKTLRSAGRTLNINKYNEKKFF